MLALPSDVGGPTTTTLDHTRNLDGARLPSSPSPSIRAGIWRCAMPRAPRQLPSLQPPNRAIQPPGANSPLDKTWGEPQTGEPSEVPSICSVGAFFNCLSLDPEICFMNF